MTQVNLLPWREEAKKHRQMRFYILLGTTFFAAFVCVILLHIFYDKKIANQTARNNYLQTETSAEQIELSALDKKIKEKMAVDKELHFVMSLRDSSYRAVLLLDELVRVIPEGVTLKKIIRDGNTVVILGKADSNLQVTLLMKNISKSRLFYDPDLTEITGKENTSGEERLFQLKFSQK